MQDFKRRLEALEEDIENRFSDLDSAPSTHVLEEQIKALVERIARLECRVTAHHEAFEKAGIPVPLDAFELKAAAERDELLMAAKARLNE